LFIEVPKTVDKTSIRLCLPQPADFHLFIITF